MTGRSRLLPPFEHRLDIVCPRFKCRRINPLKGDPAFLEEQVRLRAAGRSTGYDLDVITSASVKSAQIAMEAMATYFRREFAYDFIQYAAGERWNGRDRVLLWTRNQLRYREAVGGACFRWRTDAGPPHMALAWVWVHPFLRRRGVLSTWWPIFRDLYGGFVVERPISPAMVDFLRRHDSPSGSRSGTPEGASEDAGGDFRPRTRKRP